MFLSEPHASVSDPNFFLKAGAHPGLPHLFKVMPAEVPVFPWSVCLQGHAPLTICWISLVLNTCPVPLLCLYQLSTTQTLPGESSSSLLLNWNLKSCIFQKSYFTHVSAVPPHMEHSAMDRILVVIILMYKLKYFLWKLKMRFLEMGYILKILCMGCSLVIFKHIKSFWGTIFTNNIVLSKAELCYCSGEWLLPIKVDLFLPIFIAFCLGPCNIQ